MNNIDSKKVKSCWVKIIQGKGSDYFVDHFYELLFERRPEIRLLFPEPLKKQKSALLGMLDNVINGIEYIDELKATLTQLGKRHQHLGIEAYMYDAFIEAVVETAKQTSDHTLTNEEEDAWEQAFRTISDIMLDNH